MHHPIILGLCATLCALAACSHDQPTGGGGGPIVANGMADPTQLPRAIGQHPVAGSYGRNLAAGQTYVDPNSKVTVLKLTDAFTPATNAGMYHGYSEGGPNISQPWTGADGQTYRSVTGWSICTTARSR